MATTRAVLTQDSPNTWQSVFTAAAAATVMLGLSTAQDVAPNYVTVFVSTTQPTNLDGYQLYTTNLSQFGGGLPIPVAAGDQVWVRGAKGAVVLIS